MGIPFFATLSLTIPQQFNSYTYAFNNPIYYTDRHGLAVPVLMQCAYYAYRVYKAGKAAKVGACSVLAGFSYISCMKNCVCGDRKKCEDDIGKINRCKNKCFRVMVNDYIDCGKKNKPGPPSSPGNGYGGGGATGGW